MSRVLYVAGFILLISASPPTLADTPAQILAAIKADAAKTAGFQDFSAVRGEKFFQEKHGNELSCTSCHTTNPAAKGKHAKTDKPIDPLAPSANGERFTEMKKVQKWFKRNCNDVLERLCTAQEQGDVLSYLLTIPKS
jgi:hypothetical protein